MQGLADQSLPQNWPNSVRSRGEMRVFLGALTAAGPYRIIRATPISLYVPSCWPKLLPGVMSRRYSIGFPAERDLTPSGKQVVGRNRFFDTVAPYFHSGMVRTPTSSHDSQPSASIPFPPAPPGGNPPQSSAISPLLRSKSGGIRHIKTKGGGVRSGWCSTDEPPRHQDTKIKYRLRGEKIKA
jgi:hypothetical protein